MPVSSGDGAGSGGGSSLNCSVSPSDQVGQISNILNRLQQIEAVLAGLLGTNVEAIQLSDISNNLGWIHNVTYLGTEGWTQTPSGTLIPPAGWSGLSSIVDGLPAGTLSSGSADRPCLHKVGSSYGIATDETIEIATAQVAGYDTSKNGLTYFTPTTVSGKYGWQINTTGVYRIDLFLEISSSSATEGQVGIRISTGTGGGTEVLLLESAGPVTPVSGSGSGIYYATTISARRKLTSGKYVFVYVNNSTDAASIDVDYSEMAITLETEA